MNNSDSENDRVNDSPNNFQNDRAKNNSHETDQRPSEIRASFRIFGWDSNGKKIPEEQAQLVDQPESSSVNSTQQQSQVSPPNMQKTEESNNNLPWDVVIPHEETEEQAQLVDQPKSSSVNSIQQQSQQPPLPINYNGSLNNNNQSVFPMPNPNQVGFFSPSYYPNQYSCLIPDDISAINRQYTLNDLEIEKQRESAYIEVLKRRALHDEELRYEQEKKKLNQRFNSTETPKHINGNTSISTNEIPTFIDLKKIVDEFIKKYAIVTIKKRTKKDRVIMILDEDENRHVEISLKNLMDYYDSFIEDSYSDDAKITLRKINYETYLKNHIPKLEKSSLRCLKSHQVMFMNGFLDVREFKFYSIPESERN